MFNVYLQYIIKDANRYRETKCVNFIRNNFINGWKCTGYWYCKTKTCDNRRYKRYKRIRPKRKINDEIKQKKCNICQSKLFKKQCDFSVIYYKNTNIINSNDYNILVIRINNHTDGCLEIPPEQPKASSRAFVCNN